MTRLFALVLLFGATARAEPAQTERFSLQALELAEPAEVSADGRFSLRASARLNAADETKERFRLKTALVDCTNSQADAIFSNSFE